MINKSLLTPESIMIANRRLYQAARNYVDHKMTPANALALSKILMHQAKMCELYLIEQRLNQIENSMKNELEIEKQRIRFKALPANAYTSTSSSSNQPVIDLSEVEW